MKIDATKCRFPVGTEGRRCGRVGRVARMRIEDDAHGPIAVPYRDAAGDPSLYCTEHWNLMHDPEALEAHRREMWRKGRAARAGRRNGQRKLAYRYENLGG